jgi:lipoprotein NlpI
VPRKFLQTDHEYVHYVAVLLYAFEEGQGRDAAHKLLEARWQAVDPSGWERRLAVGDPGVWREMLIGYYLGKVSHDQLFAPLADDATFNSSPFAKLQLARLSMLCEAHFYDALLKRMHNSPSEMHAALERAISTGYRKYVEYSMAKFMLANEGKSPSSSPTVEQHTTR